jgi:hypothetical protein
MRRRGILILTLALAGCGRPAAQWSFPASIDGGWRLKSAPVRQSPDTVQAVYEGPAEATVTLRDTGSSAVAFETLQKWRPVPGTIAFQHGRYFGLVASSAPNATLNEFVAALEKTMG